MNIFIRSSPDPQKKGKRVVEP